MSAARAAQVIDEYGRPVPGASIYVYDLSGNSAAIYTDSAHTLPITQPILADEFGNYTYYAADNFYREDTWFAGRMRFRENGVAVGDTAVQFEANLATLAPSKANIDSVAGSIANVNIVAPDLANINTVAASIINVNAVGTSIANVNAVASDLTKINAVQADLANINAVAADLTDISGVAADLTAVNGVYADLANINALVADLTNVNAVSGDLTNINAVAGDLTNINAVAGDLAAINAAPAQAAAAAASAATAAQNVAGPAELASRGSYSNPLHGLTVAATNLTDGVTPTFTQTDVTAGLKISGPLFNKEVIYSTNVKTGAAHTRLLATITLNVTAGQARVGLGFKLGSLYTTISWTTNGFLRTQSNLTGSVVTTNVVATMPTFGAGDTITMQCDIKADGTCYVTVAKNGGTRVAIGTVIPAGADAYLYLFDGTTNTAAATYSIVESVFPAVSDGATAAKVLASLSSDFRAPRAASANFFAPYQRAYPAGFTAPRLPSWFKVYKRPDARLFFTTIDLQPILDPTDPTVFVQYVDIATGNDTNAGTATAPLKSIHAALLNVQTGSRAIVLVKGGLYDFANCWRSQGANGAITQVQSWDGVQVVSSMHDAGLTWASVDGTTYSATFAETVLKVFDAAHLTADGGDYSVLVLAASQAACQAAQGVTSTTSLVGGSGGTNGTYMLGFSGGGGAGALGSFVVAGGAVTSISINSSGIGYTSAPALSFAACPGLTGASATAVLGTVGAYYISGTTIYVRAVDGRAPDANIRVYKKLTSGFADHNGNWGVPGGTIYVENVAFEGGTNAFSVNISSSATQQWLYHRNCTYKYAANCGTELVGDTLVIVQGCVGAFCALDNFHYDPAIISGTATPTAIEVDCVSRYAGLDGQAQNNSSSSHGGVTIRIATVPTAGLYHHAQGRGVHDIFAGNNALSWHLGITSRDSRGGMANFVVGGSAGDASKQWNDSCNSSGATNDQEARLSAGVTIYDYDFVRGATDVVGPGTITTYVP